jgi:folate-binding protein YgfZ
MERSFHVFRPAAFLRVTGSDAATFLQGQFTNELQHSPGSATYGLWLNQKGKVLADSHVLKIAEHEFVVASIASPAGVILQRLEEYVVADDVVVVDETAAVHGLMVWGERSGEMLDDRPAAGQFVRAGGSFVFPGRQVQGDNFQIIGPEENIRLRQASLLAVGASAAGAGAAEFARISEGMPAIPHDIGPGDLPNEGGLEVAAISYTKGCYLGQEVMARLKNLGRIRRRLHVLRGSGPPPPAMTTLYQAGTKVGEIRSVAARGNEFVAFAMLSLASLNPAAGLALAPEQAPALKIISHG